MTPDILKKWNNEQEGPRGSAQTQTGTEIEKENQDRAVAADPGHSGAPDTARPGPPSRGQSPVTVSDQTSGGEHRLSGEGSRGFSEKGSETENGRTRQWGHVSDDTCSEWSRDTCRVKCNSCRDSLTVVCRGSDSKEVKSGHMMREKDRLSDHYKCRRSVCRETGSRLNV